MYMIYCLETRYFQIFEFIDVLRLRCHPSNSCVTYMSVQVQFNMVHVSSESHVSTAFRNRVLQSSVMTLIISRGLRCLTVLWFHRVFLDFSASTGPSDGNLVDSSPSVVSLDNIVQRYIITLAYGTGSTCPLHPCVLLMDCIVLTLCDTTAAILHHCCIVVYCRIRSLHRCHTTPFRHWYHECGQLALNIRVGY